MTSNLALLGHWSVRQELNRVSSVQFNYVGLYTFTLHYTKVYLTWPRYKLKDHKNRMSR